MPHRRRGLDLATASVAHCRLRLFLLFDLKELEVCAGPCVRAMVSGRRSPRLQARRTLRFFPAASHAMHEPMLAPAAPINDGTLRVEASSAPPSKRATICRLFGLLHGKELCMILGATGATLVASLLQMALPVLSGWLISAISTDKGYSQECKQSAAALDRCRRERLQQVVALMGISFLVAGITLALGLWLYMLSGERLVARLRCRLFAAYVHQDIAFYDAQKTGDLMNRLASDCTELKTTLTRSLGEGMSNTMQLGVGISLMLISSPILTLVTLGAAPIIALCGLIYGLFVAKLSERYQKALVRSSATPASTLSTLSSHPNTYTLQPPQHLHSPATPARTLSSQSSTYALHAPQRRPLTCAHPHRAHACVPCEAGRRERRGPAGTLIHPDGALLCERGVRAPPMCASWS